MLTLPRIAIAGLALLGCEIAMGAQGGETLSLGLGKIFTFFFLTLGPKAVIAPFARATATSTVSDRRKVALVATGISLLAVLIAATIGIRVLANWGISAGALLVAAGIILFLVAIESIRSQYRAPNQEPSEPGDPLPARLLAYKLAFPYVVSPYGVAVVILVLTTRPETVPFLPILAMLVGIMLLNLVVMLNAQRIAASPYIGPAMAIVGSVLGVLQAALGVQAVLVGLRMAGVISGTV
ncbi:MAG: MarC family protein [Woeseiaceae bacterium]|jgi:multiple antibiotic resistance protein